MSFRILIFLFVFIIIVFYFVFNIILVMGPRPKFKAHILSPTLTHFLQAYKQDPYKPKQTSKKSAWPTLGMSSFLPRKARQLSLLLSPESPTCWPQTSAPACCPLLLHAKHTCTAPGLLPLPKHANTLRPCSPCSKLPQFPWPACMPCNPSSAMRLCTTRRLPYTPAATALLQVPSTSILNQQASLVPSGL